MKRTLLIAASVLVGIVVVVGVLLWLFFDANQFRPRLEAAMGAASGRKVSLGHIRLAPFSGSLAIEDVSIGDDPSFGAEPFITAKSVSVGVDLMPLILSRSLHVESFRLEQPHVTLLRSNAGVWNFSGLGGRGASSGAPSGGTSTTAAGALIQKIVIAGGQVVIGNSPPRGKPRVYDGVNVEVANVSLTSRFPFRATARTPGGGTLELNGEAGPIDVNDAAATPLQATVAVTQLDIASTGFIDPASGLAGVIEFTGALTSDGRVLTSKGNMKSTRARLVPGGSPASVPFEVDYESEYTAKAQRGVLKRGDLHIGKATARLTGDYDLAGETPAIRMKLAGPKMAVTELQAALPAIGVTLPSGASMRQGTLDTELTITGPIDRLVIAGPVTLSNAAMAGFDLGAKLAPVAALAGLPHTGETVIQTLGAAVRVAAQGTQVDNLNLVVPIIGTLTGSGTISPQGAIDFAMLARLAASGRAVGGVARVASLGQPANGVPFRIQGTTSNPVFAPDVGRAVKNVVTSAETKKKATELLGGLFRKKPR